MQSKALTVEAYIAELPEERKEAVIRLRKEISSNLPEGFREEMSYGMIGYVVPHSLYPPGYHTTPKLPLPFINIASQKNYIAVYHMAISAEEGLLDWFTKEYSARCKTKLDMGRGCIRLKKIADIPYSLFGELASKMSASQWIDLYENRYKK
ncbi:MAG: DUF1801 domain-containing protein [Bacteroidales bacterium]|nr:DUF1801 domain-containing protein [Bacteroidales bacterium]